MKAKLYYDRYAWQMASLGRGIALWEPEPDKTYQRVEIGDVGHMLSGHFLRLFNVTLPPGDDRNTLGEPEGYEPLDRGVTLFGSLPARQPLWSTDVAMVGANFSTQMPVVGTSMQTNLMTSSGNGAMLVTGHDMVSEDTASRRIFKEYIMRYHESWLTFAKELGRRVELEDLILVTGRHVTEDFAMLTFAEASRNVEIGLNIGLPSIGSGHAASSINSRHFTSPDINYGPRNASVPDTPLLENQPEGSQSDAERYTQCVFLRGFRVKKRAGFLRVLEYEGHERDYEPPSVEDSEDSSDDLELISDTARTIDPTHPLLQYILDNSDASLAVVHDSDLAWVYEHNLIGSQEDLGEALNRITPDLETIDGVGCFKCDDLPLKSLRQDSESIIEDLSTEDINTQGRPWSDVTAPSVTIERGDTVMELLCDNGVDGNLDTQSSFTSADSITLTGNAPEHPPSEDFEARHEFLILESGVELK